MGTDGAGILMEPIWRSMTEAPCWTEKVWSWAMHVFMRIVLANIGSILVKTFTSSTCVTVHTSHGFGSEFWGTMAALSRSLRVHEMAIRTSIHTRVTSYFTGHAGFPTNNNRFNSELNVLKEKKRVSELCLAFKNMVYSVHHFQCLNYGYDMQNCVNIC